MVKRMEDQGWDLKECISFVEFRLLILKSNI